MCEGVGEDSGHGIGHVDIRVGSCNFLSVRLWYIVGIYFVSVDAGAQVAIILLACGPGVVIVNCLEQVVFG